MNEINYEIISYFAKDFNKEYIFAFADGIQTFLTCNRLPYKVIIEIGDSSVYIKTVKIDIEEIPAFDVYNEKYKKLKEKYE